LNGVKLTRKVTGGLTADYFSPELPQRVKSTPKEHLRLFFTTILLVCRMNRREMLHSMSFIAMKTTDIKNQVA